MQNSQSERNGTEKGENLARIKEELIERPERDYLPDDHRNNIIFMEAPNLLMYQQDINTILDSPPCPILRPKQAPISDIPDLELELEQPLETEGLDEETIKNVWETSTQTESCEMMEEQEQFPLPGKRSFNQFIGMKGKAPKISQVLSIGLRRPRKIKHF